MSYTLFPYFLVFMADVENSPEHLPMFTHDLGVWLLIEALAKVEIDVVPFSTARKE